MAWKNIGKIRLRETRWRRRVIIQVQQRDDFYSHWLRWKDATMNDLQDEIFSDPARRNIEVPSLRLVR